MPHAVELALGQQHAHFGIAGAELVRHGLDRRAGEAAIRAIDQLEPEVGQSVFPPLGRERVGVLVVDHEVHGPQLVGS